MPIDPNDIPTLDPPGTPQSTPAPIGQRFAPGTMLASRYRIVSRVGKGGMGEVFRADDLVLGQSVALMFLPETARGNHNLLTRFYEEVRIAREISHANVWGNAVARDGRRFRFEGGAASRDRDRPVMMVRVMIYGYCIGEVISRQIEKRTYEDVAFRYLSADEHPHYTTINEFRKRHFESAGGIVPAGSETVVRWEEDPAALF